MMNLTRNHLLQTHWFTDCYIYLQFKIFTATGAYGYTLLCLSNGYAPLDPESAARSLSSAASGLRHKMGGSNELGNMTQTLSSTHIDQTAQNAVSPLYRIGLEIGAILKPPYVTQTPMP